MQDYLADLVGKFEAAEEAGETARREAEQARDYYNGEQLTEQQIAALNKRKQPIVIENLIQPKIDYLCGLERQTRTDPKALPRTSAHEQDAGSITDALRYVCDDQDYAIKRSGVFQNMLVEGFGGVEVGHHNTRQGVDPKIKHLEWDRLFFDPHSCQADFSDAEYLGFVTWMDLDKAKKNPDWEGKTDALDATYAAAGQGNTFDDKPNRVSWADPKRRRVRVVTIYCKVDGAWHRAVYTQKGYLEELAPSPYLDEDGEPDCAIILQSAYVDRDNDRFGIVRHYKTLQDEVNKRRSKFLHLSNSRPIRVSPATGLSAEQARKEMHRPDGVVIAEAGEVEIIPTGDMAAGHFNLLAEAKDAIKAVGPNATMQGKGSQDSSGRAIMALQQGGMVEMAPLLDNLRHFNVRVYRALWNRIRQFWTAERWVRVTDDEATVRFVGLNTTKGALAAYKLKAAMDAGQIDQQTAQAYAMQLQADPRMAEPANVIAELDVDIDLDEVPSVAHMQAENLAALSQLAPVTPPQFMPVLFELMVEAMPDLKNKDKLREIIEQIKTAPPDPAQEQMKMLALAGQQAEVEKTQSETAENMASAQATIAKAQTDAFQAGARAAA